MYLITFYYGFLVEVGRFKPVEVIESLIMSVELYSL